jgi:hypothetical protein
MKYWFAKRVFHDINFTKSLWIAIGFLLAGCGSVAAEKLGQSINTLGTGGRPAIVIGDDAPVVATLWDGAEYGYVRIEKAEQSAQAANDHPIAFTPQQIRTAFSELQIQRGDKDPKALFTEQGLDDIAEPIATALAQAQPDQDVTFAVTGKQGQGVLNLIGDRLVTSGRLFYQDGQLNVIFGAVQAEFEDTLRATGILRNFIPGSRNGPITPTRLKVQPVEGVQYASAGRVDWLQLAPYAWSEKPAKSPQDMAPVGVPVAPVTNLPTESPSDPSGSTNPPPPAKTTTASVAPEVAPINPSSPMPVATPKSAAAATTSTTVRSDEAYYQHFEKRLKTLSKLRDRDVITEKEYQERRRAILGEL